MEYRFLGRTGVRVSMLGLGTMAFGGDADAATSGALYARARDAGINLFDCADVYAGGESEHVLGRLIAAHRDDVVIASKAYFPTGDKGPNDRGSSRYHLVRAVEASLRRLKTDRIDLYFLHRFDDETDLAESLRALDDLVRQGKILYPALSNFAAWQAQRAVDLCERHGWARPVCVQPMYNLAKRQAEVEILPQAKANDLAVMPYSPLGGGLLTGKYGRDRQPQSGRLVENTMYQTRYGDEWVMDVADDFAALARARGYDPVALAVAWVGSHPAVTAPIIGARSVEQLEGSLRSVDIPMTPELRAEIAALSPEPPPATDRNEERTPHNYGLR
ncbi:MAG: aldo/keto reductase [Anaerolineales bacterium]|nr:aldo/keto reductase [Anaerolineales bacterium]